MAVGIKIAIGKKAMPKQETTYSNAWENDDRYKHWVTESNSKDKVHRAKCKWCTTDFSIAHGGTNDLDKHASTIKHKGFQDARLTVPSVKSIFCEFFLFENCYFGIKTQC